MYGLIILFAALFLLPFYWMVNTALKPPNQVFDLPPAWYPNPSQWMNFYEALSASTASESSPSIYGYAWNTTIITVSSLIGTVVSSSLVAYAFARRQFFGRDVLFLGVLGTLMIPFAVVMVPQFIIWKNLAWLDTLWPLIVPLVNFSVAYSRVTPWNLYMAASLIIILPCLILFFFSQQAFLKGITIIDFKR